MRGKRRASLGTRARRRSAGIAPAINLDGIEPEARDFIDFFAAEEDDGSFRVSETVRADAEMFLEWLRKYEPNSVRSEEHARVNAHNRVLIERRRDV